MKLFVILAIAALACGEPVPEPVGKADPVFMTYSGLPLTYASPHATVGMKTYASGAVVPDDTLSVKMAKASHFTAKANEYMKKPMMTYMSPYSTWGAGVIPSTYGAGVIPTTWGAGVIPSTFGTGFIKTIKKRDAETDPNADPYMFYTGAGATTPFWGSSYMSPYSTYGSSAFMSPYMSHYIKKRSAEAETDPVFYSTSGLGVGMTGYGTGLTAAGYSSGLTGVSPYTAAGYTSGYTSPLTYSSVVIPSTYSSFGTPITTAGMSYMNPTANIWGTGIHG